MGEPLLQHERIIPPFPPSGRNVRWHRMPRPGGPARESPHGGQNMLRVDKVDSWLPGGKGGVSLVRRRPPALPWPPQNVVRWGLEWSVGSGGQEDLGDRLFQHATTAEAHDSAASASSRYPSQRQRRGVSGEQLRPSTSFRNMSTATLYVGYTSDQYHLQRTLFSKYLSERRHMFHHAVRGTDVLLSPLALRLFMWEQRWVEYAVFFIEQFKGSLTGGSTPGKYFVNWLLKSSLKSSNCIYKKIIYYYQDVF